MRAHGQVSDLIGELAAGGSAELNVKLDDGVVPRLLAYSRSVAGFPTAVKEVSRWHAAWRPFLPDVYMCMGGWPGAG